MITLAIVEPFISVNNVSKEIIFHNNKLVILQDLSLAIKYGQSVAIKGVSGSGKTTLLGLLAGLDNPTAGTILVGAQELTKLSEDAKAELRRKYCGFIFQNFQLLPNLTAMENVMLALELQQSSNKLLPTKLSLTNKTKPSDLVTIKETASELLARVGLKDRLHHYPSQLSGGEQQRVAIARAFVVQPKVLFADEPTANIDQKTAQNIIDLLFTLQIEHHSTMVVVTHDPVLAERCECQYTLQQGKLSNLNSG